MYRTILVPLDDSTTARRGLDEAIALALALDAQLRLLHVVDARLLLGHVTSRASPERMLADWREGGRRLVREAVARAEGKGVRVSAEVRCDPGFRVCEQILNEVGPSGADLIVMGTHGRRGLQRAALGSDAELVVRGSTVPVLLVRALDAD